ncbi:hypothetical protein PVAND_003509 [Polypedilum vanderplanki]|uniref:Uncharacterized protein n=1 Tax=Polypedilum vanderplanki TaxID=319348 RepID=A0A9J6BUS0_POLVA|nr:hypothetical protein PVAND_003509 [Polypedilum vanderplanki]
MKKFIVLLCLVAIVLAQRGGENGEKGGRGEQNSGRGGQHGGKGAQNGTRAEQNAGRGGEKGGKGQHGGRNGEGRHGGPSMCNVTRPANVEANDCCPNKPKALSCLSGKTCKSQCKGNGPFPDICCMAKCSFQNSTTNGAIDANGVINALVSQVQNGTVTWKTAITTIVNFCIGNAQADIQKMKDEVAAVNSTDRSVFFKKVILNCSNSDQIVIDYCIKTKLFYDCPTRVTSDSCNSLYQYAQSCPHDFFFRERGHGKGGKGSNEGSAEKSRNGAQKKQGKQGQGQGQGKNGHEKQGQGKQ